MACDVCKEQFDELRLVYVIEDGGQGECQMQKACEQCAEVLLSIVKMNGEAWEGTAIIASQDSIIGAQMFFKEARPRC